MRFIENSWLSGIEDTTNKSFLTKITGNWQDPVWGKLIACDLLKTPLTTAMWSLSATGFINLTKGIVEISKGKINSLSRVTKGIFQIGFSKCASKLIPLVTPEILSETYQSALLGWGSSFMIQVGLNDLSKGHYVKGIGETLLGIGGMASSLYWAFNLLSSSNLPNHENSFVQTHFSELKNIAEKDQISTHGWQKICGDTTSKVIYKHQDLPDKVFKFPRRIDSPGIFPNTCTDYANYKIVQTAIDALKLNHLEAIKTDYFLIGSDCIVLQDDYKTSQIDESGIYDSSIYRRELYKLEDATGLYDLVINQHNTVWKESKNKKIVLGFFDFDHLSPFTAIAAGWRFANTIGLISGLRKINRAFFRK